MGAYVARQYARVCSLCRCADILIDITCSTRVCSLSCCAERFKYQGAPYCCAVLKKCNLSCDILRYERLRMMCEMITQPVYAVWEGRRGGVWDRVG